MIALLTKATTRAPNFAQAFAFLTEIEARRYGELETTPAQDTHVLDLAQTVARLRPGSGDAYKAAGMHAFYVSHNTSKAITEFTEAVRCLPNDAQSWQFLGSCECRQGRWEDALAHGSQASKLDPENVDVTSVHEMTLERMGRYREAAAILDGWLAQHPYDDWAMLSRADTELAWTGVGQTARAMLATHATVVTAPPRLPPSTWRGAPWPRKSKLVPAMRTCGSTWRPSMRRWADGPKQSTKRPGGLLCARRNGMP